jgi:hypothetical protein
MDCSGPTGLAMTPNRLAASVIARGVSDEAIHAAGPKPWIAAAHRFG